MRMITIRDVLSDTSFNPLNAKWR